MFTLSITPTANIFKPGGISKSRNEDRLWDLKFETVTLYLDFYDEFRARKESYLYVVLAMNLLVLRYSVELSVIPLVATSSITPRLFHRPIVARTAKKTNVRRVLPQSILSKAYPTFTTQSSYNTHTEKYTTTLYCTTKLTHKIHRRSLQATSWWDASENNGIERHLAMTPCPLFPRSNNGKLSTPNTQKNELEEFTYGAERSIRLPSLS